MAVDTAIAEELFFEEFIVSADGINLEYKVGCLDSSAGPIDIAILGVGRLGHLVCVPGAVWDKRYRRFVGSRLAWLAESRPFA